MDLQQISDAIGFPVIPDPVYFGDQYPVDGYWGTGVGRTDPGSLYIATSGQHDERGEQCGELFVNVNSRESPCWARVGTVRLHRLRQEVRSAVCKTYPTELIVPSS